MHACVVSADAVGLWRMFEPDFEGQVDLIPVELRQGFNLEIVGNFRVPKRDVLRAPVPEGEKGIFQVVLVFQVYPRNLFA